MTIGGRCSGGAPALALGRDARDHRGLLETDVCTSNPYCGGHLGGGLGVDQVVHRHHRAERHQAPLHLGGLGTELVRELGHADRVRRRARVAWRPWRRAGRGTQAAPLSRLRRRGDCITRGSIVVVRRTVRVTACFASCSCSRRFTTSRTRLRSLPVPAADGRGGRRPRANPPVRADSRRTRRRDRRAAPSSGRQIVNGVGRMSSAAHDSPRPSEVSPAPRRPSHRGGGVRRRARGLAREQLRARPTTCGVDTTGSGTGSGARLRRRITAEPPCASTRRSMIEAPGACPPSLSRSPRPRLRRASAIGPGTSTPSDLARSTDLVPVECRALRRFCTRGSWPSWFRTPHPVRRLWEN